MKPLVVIACVIVIAAGGLYLWKEYQSYQRTQNIARNRQYLINRAGVANYGPDEVGEYCKAVLSLIDGKLKGNEFAEVDANLCRAFGYAR